MDILAVQSQFSCHYVSNTKKRTVRDTSLTLMDDFSKSMLFILAVTLNITT